MIGKVPALPDQKEHGLLQSSLLHSQWRVSGSRDCEISGNLQTRLIDLRMSTTTLTTVHLDGRSFKEWPSFAEERGYETQQLAVLTLAWAYIFSAFAIERQGGESSILRYTENLAIVDAFDDRDTL